MDTITIQVEIFIIAVIGYYLGLKGTLDAMTRVKLVDVIMNVVMTASVVKSFQIGISAETLALTIGVFLISCGLQLLYVVWNRFSFRHTTPEHKVCLRYAIMCSNAGLIGMPMAQAYFGTEGLLCASIFLIPQRVLMWTYGVSLFSGTTDRHVVRKLLTNPCVIAVFVGFGVMALTTMGIALPAPVVGTLDVLSGCGLGLSMLVVGAIISECPLKEMLNREALIYSFQRLVAIPVLAAVLLGLLPLSASSAGVCVLLSAMPAASTTAMFAEKYHADARFASQLVLTSTALSMVTVPVVMIAVQALWLAV